MEGEETTTTTTSSTSTTSVPSSPPHDPDILPIGSSSTSVPSSPPHDPDILPIGSPETTVSQVPVPPSDDDHSSDTLAFTDNLRDKIIKQVEYYFSDENLPTDKFLMNYVKKDKEGFVPVAVLASFRKMKKLIQDSSSIVAALRESSLLVVSKDGKKVKRFHPLPFTEVKDSKLCTVLVENLPEDHSTENIQRIFGEAGNIKNIFIHDPHAVEEPRKCSKEEKLIWGKVYARIEYDTMEAAEKAVVTLNNEQDWRNGMRVKLLKQVGNYGPRKKGWRGSDSEKNINLPASDPAEDEENHNLKEHHDGTPNEDDEEHLSKKKNGQRGQHRGRSRGQKYRGINGHGHGTISYGHGSEASKPPPGPRMPDGTRGFTMGRGRPPVSNQN